MVRKERAAALSRIPANDLVNRYKAVETKLARERNAPLVEALRDNLQLLRDEMEKRMKRRDRGILKIAAEALKYGAEELASEQLEATRTEATKVVASLGTATNVASGQHETSLPKPPSAPSADRGRRRSSFVMPLLAQKGWSTRDWAVNAEVDFHTVNDFLKGRTDPYRSTRKKLAESLGVAVEKLPA